MLIWYASTVGHRAPSVGAAAQVATEQATRVLLADRSGRWGPTPISGPRHTHMAAPAHRRVDPAPPGKWVLRPMGFPGRPGHG
ncbi:hypothetical protein SLI_6555 [Streptomyces lividans 1326]|uniref:Uncharacterized protein n=1 Tax=Streptomyces lividans 1326 TaxID=1200984 RepID=A0A7U9E0Z2_STRLI|nr:hypothetical protein SLI_6555 [Streptomyces lividans 1326]